MLQLLLIQTAVNMTFICKCICKSQEIMATDQILVSQYLSVHVRKRTAFNCPFRFTAGLCGYGSVLHGHFSLIDGVEEADKLCKATEQCSQLQSAPECRGT